MKLRILLITSLLLAGCASNNYKQYYQAQSDIAKSSAQAEADFYKSASAIAGDSEVNRTALLVGMLMMRANGSGKQAANIAAPRDWTDTMLQALQVITPAATAGLLGYYGYKTNVNASDNTRDVSIANSNAFVGMADKIQAPGATTTTNNTTTSSYNPYDLTVQQPATAAQ